MGKQSNKIIPHISIFFLNKFLFNCMIIKQS